MMTVVGVGTVGRRSMGVSESGCDLDRGKQAEVAGHWKGNTAQS